MGGEPNLYTDQDIDEIVANKDKRIAELEAALQPFAVSAKMMAEDGRTDEDLAALVLGTDLTPSDFWTAKIVMGL